jgi:hypothetical protein
MARKGPITWHGQPPPTFPMMRTTMLNVRLSDGERRRQTHGKEITHALEIWKKNKHARKMMPGIF